MTPTNTKPRLEPGRQAERSINTRMICPPLPVVNTEIPISDLRGRVLRLEELASYLLGEVIRLRGGGYRYES